MVVRVGCCGFPVSRERYRRVFDLVEINATFYRYPRDSLLEKWRKEAPENFEFTVKAHQDISHKHRMETSAGCLNAFKRMVDICHVLGARILLIQTPASFKPTSENLERLEEFFCTIDRGGLTVVWESRGRDWENPSVRVELAKVLSEADVSHVTDPLRVMPAHTGGIAYFRLHGLGARMYYYQYNRNEMESLVERIRPLENSGKEVYVLFNNLSMWEDGRRLIKYLREGDFSGLRGEAGLDSVRGLLTKTGFPITRSRLSRSVGWRLIDLGDGREVRLDELLAKTSSRVYRSIEELIEEIQKGLDDSNRL
ncbi:MAG: DUF72 domain-containing protein [Candidatus Bathyarchaeia archaeon]